MRLSWKDFITIENLNIIADRLARGSSNKYRMDIIEFYANYGKNIIKLHKELKDGTYVHDTYNFFSFKNNKNKIRLIHYSKFRDMIVEKILGNYLLHLYNKTFIKDTYSGLVDRGMLNMVKRVSGFQKEAYYKYTNPMLIKLDVEKYFDSINRNIVFDIIKNKTNDDKFLNIFGRCLFSQTHVTGICFGNLTSSIIGNIYLDEFDHYIKDVLKVDYMCRYMDDTVLIVDMPKVECRRLYHDLNQYLIETRNIKFNTSKVLIRDINHIPLLGFSLKMTRGNQVIKLASRNKSRYLKLIKSYSPDKIQRLNSWWGFANIADCRYMINRSLKGRDIIFTTKFEQKPN